ncbi:ARM repeat-containing protein [Trametes sanguinea]|nr:ARM repeat-containing protein [Trametes sanguinea]
MHNAPLCAPINIASTQFCSSNPTNPPTHIPMGSLASTEYHHLDGAELESNELPPVSASKPASSVSTHSERPAASKSADDVVCDAAQDTKEEYSAHARFVPATPASTPGSVMITDGPTLETPSQLEHNSPRDDDEPPTRALTEVLTMLSRLTSSKSTCAHVADSLFRLVTRSDEEDGYMLWVVSKCICHAAAQRDRLAEHLASLSSQLVEQLSDTSLHDKRVKDRDGVPLSGGQLFRSHLLRSCEAAFNIRMAAHGVRGPVMEGEDEADYADDIARARRQGPGLLKFISELFNAGLLADRVIHSCLKTLLGDRALSHVRCIEDAYVLLQTAGRTLDTPQAREAVDSYFSRIEKRVAEKPNGTWRIRSMLEELVKLRQDGWPSADKQDHPSSYHGPWSLSPQDESTFRGTWRLSTRSADDVETWRRPVDIDVAVESRRPDDWSSAITQNHSSSSECSPSSQSNLKVRACWRPNIVRHDENAET